MYPSGESFNNIASVAFLNALQDANLLFPTGDAGAGQLLFPSGLVDVRLGGDAAIVGSNRTVQLPIPGVVITIGRAYGREVGYAGDTYKDVQLWIPFSVWVNSGDGTQDEIERRLAFARDHRQNVFSAHGLNLILGGVVGSVPRGQSPVTGLDVVDYRWRFWYSRADNGGVPFGVAAPLALGGQPITGVADPVHALDAANKEYVDEQVASAGGGGEVSSNTGTTTSVSAATASKVLLAANATRKGVTIFNDTLTGTLYVACAASASLSPASWAIKVGPQDLLTLPFNYTGEISGIWDVVDGNGQALVTEFT